MGIVETKSIVPESGSSSLVAVVGFGSGFEGWRRGALGLEEFFLRSPWGIFLDASTRQVLSHEVDNVNFNGKESTRGSAELVGCNFFAYRGLSTRMAEAHYLHSQKGFEIKYRILVFTQFIWELNYYLMLLTVLR